MYALLTGPTATGVNMNGIAGIAYVLVYAVVATVEWFDKRERAQYRRELQDLERLAFRGDKVAQKLLENHK